MLAQAATRSHPRSVFRAGAMAMEISPPWPVPALKLFLAVHEEDVDNMELAKNVPTRYVSPHKDVIGLREQPEQAVDRYRSIFKGDVPKSKLKILEVTFTVLGIAVYSVGNCGAEHRFRPRLSKQVYGADVDWGVWHFIGDLPLNFGELLSYKWLAIE